jgi:threonylcarbamoyladenosine tRNA methylthiotransferase MtaB
VITGVNTGDFGRTTGERFEDLLSALDTVGGIERYRISSIEPNLLTDSIIDFCAASAKFQPHFHIPLQSGSDRVLASMRRRYTTDRFADRIARVRSVMPEAFIGIDVIVGFPGETESDFEQTYAFLEKITPAYIHVFPYSVRPGTPAADFTGKVPPAVATHRAEVLGELCRRLHREFSESRVGSTAEVLFEGGRKEGMMFGFTPNYIKIMTPYDKALVNHIGRVRPLSWDEAKGAIFSEVI